MRLALMVLMPLAITVAPARHALALSACLSDAIGTWRGPVLNGPGLEDMTTIFFLGSDGNLVGTYHIEDAVPFDGTLTDFRAAGDCAGDFRWHDRNGSGTVHIRFQPELGRFVGRWGVDRPVQDNVFNGNRRLSPTS